MLDTLFPRASKKCLELPLLGSVMEGFEDWLVEQRYARLYIRSLLRVVRKVDTYLRRKGVHRIEDVTHVAIHHYWKTLRHRTPWESGAIRVLDRFLRRRGVLNSCQVPTPTALQVAEYSEYLRQVRGLTSGSINEQARIAERLLTHLDFDKATERLADIGPGDIEGFVRKLSKSLSRATLRNKVTLVRNFLRFLAAKGKVSPDLVDQIDRPRVYRLEKLPRTLHWKTVQALLRSIPKTTVKGRRDYTMLFLMASYGLRTCEVVALTLDDIDWRAGVIQIRQTKTRNDVSLPLTDEAAKALIGYLREVPRPAGDRHLFFQLRAPIRSLKRAALREAFVAWSQRSGLEIPFQGPHCIRHSYAVHLLSQSTPLKTIGDLLGHRHPESTANYLRLATDQLREVGLPVPRTLLKRGGRP